MPTPSSKSLHGIKGENFTIRLEYNKDYIIVHLPSVDKFSVGDFKEMRMLLEDWSEFFMTVGYDGLYAAIDPNNSKLARLVSRLGFKKLGGQSGRDVYRFRGE